MHAAWILVLLVAVTQVRPQAEILSITSFIECVEIDRTAFDGSAGTVQPGNFLDCTTDNATKSDTVTIVNLRLTAGTDSDSTFFFNLNSFNAQNSASQTSTQPSQCIADVVNGATVPTDCQLTTDTFAVQFTNTKYNYYYTLELESDFDIPYCHVMQYADTLTQTCNNIFPVGDNPFSKFTATCEARVEQLVRGQSPGSGQNANTENAAHYYNMFDSSKIQGILSGLNENGTAFDTTPYYYVAPTGSCATAGVGSLCVRTEFSSDIFRKPSGPMRSTGPPPVWKWDDGVSIDEGSIYPTMAYTDHTLPLPNPIPYGLDQSTVFTSGTGFGKGSGTLQILNCLGTCPANTQNCYSTYDPTEPDARRSNGTVLEAQSLDIALFALGPQCAVYSVSLLPRVAVVVTMNVTNLATGEVTTVNTSNVNPGEQQSSSNKFVAFGIRSVGTINNILGPPIGGKIVVCGPIKELTETSYLPSVKFNLLIPTTDDANTDDPKEPAFPDMRDFAAPDDEVDNVLYNPWENIAKITKERGDVTEGYFPSNRYMKVNVACDEDGKQLPGTTRICRNSQQMFFYIPPEYEGTIGRGCNQIGITDQFWNANGDGSLVTGQFAADTCGSDPAVCVPGFALNFVTEGNVVDLNNFAVTGCMASTAYEIMREVDINDIYNQTDIDGLNTTYWRKYGSVAPDFNLGDSVSAFATSQIYRKNMPPGYNYKTPNFWLQTDDGTRRMYWDPSISTNDPKHTNVQMPKNFPISFDMTAYFLGKFLGYAAVVPSGKIVQSSCVANTALSEISNMTVAVNNTGTSVGDYVLEVSCPQGSNIQVLQKDSQKNFDAVAPGEVSPGQIVGFQFDSTTPTDSDPNTDTLCELVLYPKSSVLTTLDDQLLNSGCKHEPAPPSPNQPPSPAFTPKFHPPPPTVCPWWCAFGCYLYSPDKNIDESPCFWFIVLAFGGGVTAAVVQLMYIQYLKYEDKIEASIIQGNEEDYRDEVSKKFSQTVDRKK